MLEINRRRFLELSTAAAAACALPRSTFASGIESSSTPTSPSQRGLLIYIDPRLGKDVDSYRGKIESSLSGHELLNVLASGRPLLYISAPTKEQLAFNHVLLIALPDDPLLSQAWQREALIEPASQSIYAFGFGHLQGSIGYLEADRNPFLHSSSVVKAPYECEWISLTGTDQSGVLLAVEAFLNQGLVNGLVAAPGWRRPATTLLDRQPLTPGFVVPSTLPSQLESLRRVAITQTSEDEYRGALADTGVFPKAIWQAKYFAPSQWDSAGQIASFYNYATGLHRRAYGNAVWHAQFLSPAEASAAATKIAAAAKLRSTGSDVWIGDLPSYAWGLPEMGDALSPGELTVQIRDENVLLSALSRR